MNNIDKIRGLLEKVKSRLQEPKIFYEGERNDTCCYVIQVLELLPPPCEVCGGSGNSKKGNWLYDVCGTPVAWKADPCPACQSAGEAEWEIKDVIPFIEERIKRFEPDDKIGLGCALMCYGNELQKEARKERDE